MKERLAGYGRPGAMLGGVIYIVAFLAGVLIYGVFAERTKDNFFGDHAFIHMIDTPMFVLLALGAIGVFVSQRERLGLVGKIGFWITLAGFAVGAVGGTAIIAVGLAVSDAATLGFLDFFAHGLSHMIYALGSLVFGIALLRKGTLPKLGAILMAVGPIWLFAMFMGGFGDGESSLLILLAPLAATGIGWMLLGYALHEREGSIGPELGKSEPAVR